MEFDELLITTGVDALVKLVKERQKVELVEAASILSISQTTIEEWSRVLEEEGILRLEYRLTRVYLVWIKPTEEEVETDRRTFYEEKKELVTDVEGVKQDISLDIKSVEELNKTFSEFYEKAYLKLEQLEKVIANIPAAKTITDDTATKNEEKILELDKQLETLRESLEASRNEIRDASDTQQRHDAGELIEKIQKMNEEMNSLKSELDAMQKKAAKVPSAKDIKLPPVPEVKRKFESLKKEFTDMRAKNARLNEDMVSIHESSEILKNVAGNMMNQEGKVAKMKIEIQTISDEVAKILERVEELKGQTDTDADLVDRLEETINVAKGILNRFPSQEKVAQELDKLKNSEDKLGEKLDAFEKILRMMDENRFVEGQFDELEGKVSEKSVQIKNEMETLANMLEEEKSTYLAFQKIKERITGALENYQKQIGAIDDQINKLREEADIERVALEKDSEKIKEVVTKGELGDTLKLVAEIKEKKKMLEEIKKSLEETTEISDNLNKRMTLISREAKLLELRTSETGTSEAPPGTLSTPRTPETEEKEKEIRKQMELSEAEEIEFRKKREELKNLIKKLWEEEK